MTIRTGGAVPRQLGSLFHVGAIGSSLTDGQLVERFAASGDESAFAALVERHGPLVHRICCTLLGDEHDAEDAFQATFLVLVRKAGSLWTRDSLGPWLSQVAYRAACCTRSARIRRRTHEGRAARPASACLIPESEREDLERALYEEIERLPERYRTLVVLCDLQGCTHEEAARRVRCPVGTVKSRLARGRLRLRERLTRRGVACTPEILALATRVSTAPIPAELIRSTLRSASALAAGNVGAGAVPAPPIELARDVLRGMAPDWLRTSLLPIFLVLVGSMAIRAEIATPQSQEAGMHVVATSTPKSLADTRTIVIHVVDADGKPVEGVRIFRNHVYRMDRVERPKIENKDYRTNAEGDVIVSLSGRTVDLRLWASKPGFVPLHAMWAKRFQADGDRIPAEFTFRLERGTEIGGVVDDEHGRPIPGVRVEVKDLTAVGWDRVDPARPGRRPVRAIWLAEDRDAAVTDNSGRWKLNVVPPDESLRFPGRGGEGILLGPPAPDSAIELHFRHPDYTSDELGWGELQRRQGVTIRSLRDQTARVRLTRK